MAYDARAVSHVVRLRRAVPRRSQFDDVAVELGALFNALEAHLENGGDVAVVAAYRQAFAALATLREIDPAHIDKATTIFDKLTQYLSHPSTAR
jgi:hypothetical protein